MEATVNETSYAFYCGSIVTTAIAVQFATLMFEEARKAPLWGMGIFFVTTFVVQQAHDYLCVSWRVLFGCSILYFMLTMQMGNYFTRRRTRRHKARMAELQAEEDKLRAKYESMYEKEFH
jgi:hypothetical protein